MLRKFGESTCVGLNRFHREFLRQGVQIIAIGSEPVPLFAVYIVLFRSKGLSKCTSLWREAHLFDHLTSEIREADRNARAKLFRRFQIKNKLEFGGLFDRQVPPDEYVSGFYQHRLPNAFRYPDSWRRKT
jgi:hypothetical protein